MTQNGLKTQKNTFLSIFDARPHPDPPLGWVGGAGNLAVFGPREGFLSEKCKYLKTDGPLGNFCRQPFWTKISPRLQRWSPGKLTLHQFKDMTRFRSEFVRDGVCPLGVVYPGNLAIFGGPGSKFFFLSEMAQNVLKTQKNTFLSIFDARP